MPNNIRISISYANEHHQFVFASWCKKALIVLLALLTASILGTFGYLQYKTHLSENAVKSVLARTTELSEQLQESSQKHFQLEQLIDNSEESYAQMIEAKNSELNTLYRRVSTVEDLMGLDDDKEQPINERIDAAAINASVRATILQLIPNGKPIQSFRRSSGYGSRTHPVTGKVTFHYGLDLTANIGTPVYSTADGVIEQRRAGNTGYGNVIKVRHGFGFMTVYAHLNKFNVTQGQFVKKGQVIGWSGNTGMSTGPHLHYEVRFLDRPLSPRNFIDWGTANFEKLFKTEKRVKWSELVKVIKTTAETNIKLASVESHSDLNGPLLAKNSN